jgi:hypothetical protein
VQTVSSSTAETVINNPALGTALVLTIPANSVLEQIPFLLLVSGYFNLGTSSTVTLKLYNGTAITGTLLKSSGALSAFSGKTNFWIKARLIYDSVSGTLTGTVEFFCNNVIVAAAAVTNVPTGISGTANPVTNFVVSVTFGTGGTQVIGVHEFAIYDNP